MKVLSPALMWYNPSFGFELPLRLARGEDIRPPARPQEPERPLPYIEEEVEFDNAEAGITLAGTLTLPGGEGRAEQGLERRVVGRSPDGFPREG